jgi:hypothetical protein
MWLIKILAMKPNMAGRIWSVHYCGVVLVLVLLVGLLAVLPLELP